MKEWFLRVAFSLIIFTTVAGEHCLGSQFGHVQIERLKEGDPAQFDLQISHLSTLVNILVKELEEVQEQEGVAASLQAMYANLAWFPIVPMQINGLSKGVGDLNFLQSDFCQNSDERTRRILALETSAQVAVRSYLSRKSLLLKPQLFLSRKMDHDKMGRYIVSNAFNGCLRSEITRYNLESKLGVQLPKIGWSGGIIEAKPRHHDYCLCFRNLRMLEGDRTVKKWSEWLFIRSELLKVEETRIMRDAELVRVLDSLLLQLSKLKVLQEHICR